jgi:Lrp/AsnC family transcriptional regulator
MSGAEILDQVDKRILRIVQNDACISISNLAAKVALSQTPCWNRLQRLRASGVIKRRVAILDQKKLGLETTVFVSVQVGAHMSTDLARFAAKVAAMEEVTDFCRMGDMDYILRVVVPDAAAFDTFYNRLIALMPLKSVTSRFVMENIKRETALPIND